jgi:peptidoglycan hydrolase-like protein with peptidoglycan-binding domain
MFPSTAYLRLGNNGPYVLELQQALNLGDSQLPALVEDGSFGMHTYRRVCEFQQDNTLTPDGVVGPNTIAVLQDLLKMLNGIGAAAAGTGTAAQNAARDRIVATAQSLYNGLRWFDGAPPDPTSPRIAGVYCADSTTRARQGGVSLMTIFTVAGGPEPMKCLTISEPAHAMYQQKPPAPASTRNTLDIVSWCGIFALYVYKQAGLKMSAWPLRYDTVYDDELDILQPRQAPQRGDIGVVDPGNYNHHFIVIDCDGSTITSIDGNAGVFQEVVQHKYTVAGVRQGGGYFLTPMWDVVLPK